MNVWTILGFPNPLMRTNKTRDFVNPNRECPRSQQVLGAVFAIVSFSFFSSDIVSLALHHLARRLSVPNWCSFGATSHGLIEFNDLWETDVREAKINHFRCKGHVCITMTLILAFSISLRMSDFFVIHPFSGLFNTCILEKTSVVDNWSTLFSAQRRACLMSPIVNELLGNMECGMKRKLKFC